MQTAINQNGKSKTLRLVLLGLCIFYFLLALGIFILPFDVLSHSSLAFWFVEAMLEIYPAVERAFTHTDFTQKAAFYIAYMGIVKVVTLTGFVAACLLCGSKENKACAIKEVRKENPVVRVFISFFCILWVCFLTNRDFTGYDIGYRKPRNSPGYEWILKFPGELFWQMMFDLIFLAIVAACILYVALQIQLLFHKRNNA
ncbi:hypothetical protein [Campylobacter sp. RM16188]|uniref:hypothetical protein n=1 Tax=Campylobacter sp. RM16188 TaxID=1705725 RepID=UPI00155499D0|nr:hypothetical protein [Campylobacter sp. RM16188]